MQLLVIGWLISSGFASIHAVAAESADSTASPAAVSYSDHVLPLLRTHCWGCHQGAKQSGGYQMTDFAGLLAGGDSGQPAIVPGNPDDSHLLQLITAVDGHAEMPPSPAPPLSAADVQQIRQWIAAGAIDDLPQSQAAYDPQHPPVYQNPPTIVAVDCSPDGRWIAASGHHEVFLMRADDGQRVARLIGASPRINQVRFSPDSSRLAVVGGTPSTVGEVQIWDVASASLQLSQTFGHDVLYGASWSPDGRLLSFGGGDNRLRAINTTTGQQELFQGAHEDWVLDTGFTPDGSHVISVARDMSCKLTEVATERFIDNITSITPGALSGGLNSIAVHPARNEILVGGADGIAKVYRVFRETERQIGDDANLIRQLPAMTGRIFSVAISRDGSRLAAVATLDGVSQVRVWGYDFDGTLSDEIKALQARRVAELNAEQLKQLNDYRAAPVTEHLAVELPSVAAYAIQFTADNGLIVSGSDGLLRRYDPSGQLQSEIAVLQPAELAAADEVRLAFDVRQWTAAASAQDLARRQATAALFADRAAAATPIDAIVELQVSPESVLFDRPIDYAQLVVSGIAADGSRRDLTRQVSITAPDFVAITANGLLRPIADGSGDLQISAGDLTVTVPLRVANVHSSADETPSPQTVDFIRDVNPVLSFLGCNQGTCHGAQAGKNGFKMSLRGYDPIFDLRSLTDDHAARRINVAAPDQSLMLQKPLGVSPHQGGTLLTDNDPGYVILKKWIAAGFALDLETPRVQRIELYPSNPVVQQIGQQQQVRVVAYYADGLVRDVTQEAFVTSGNTEVAELEGNTLLTAVRRGEASILARYEGSYAATTLTVMGDRDGFQWQQPPAWNPIDDLVAHKWQRMKIQPSELAGDEVLLRRVYLDLTGLPPSSETVRQFLADSRPSQTKRSEVIDQLIGSSSYVDFWTNKWADLLMVNRKFLGEEGAVAFRGWIRQSVAENQPYDQFVHQILTATGTNRETPQAAYYKILRNAEDTVENTTHLFLGIRFNCNKCHDHPFERWTQDQYYQTAAFFSRTQLKADPQSGDKRIGGSAVEGSQPLYEEVYDALTGDLPHGRTGTTVQPQFPYELPGDAAAEPTAESEADTRTQRQQLADWLTAASNPYFASSYVNRVWFYMTGVGLIDPVDDIRASNPPSNPELLQFLTERFVDSGFDRAELLRLICNSRTYQLAMETNRWNEDDTINFSRAIPRRLPAEVLYDTVHFVTGSTSEIPGVPKGTRATELSDVGVKTEDGFLQNLGRPVRESACECERSSDLQLGPVMALVSGPTVGEAIADPEGGLPQLTAQLTDDRQLVDEIFLRALGRQATDTDHRVFAQLQADIQQMHGDLQTELQQREQWWQTEELRLQAARTASIAAAEAALAAAVEASRPDQERLAAEREQRIAAANAQRGEAAAAVEQRLLQWEADHRDSTEWFPLIATQLSSSNGDALRTLEDRSISVSGNAQPATYELAYETQLGGITGLRLESLPIDRAQNKGAGLSGNSNFVITELELWLVDRADPSQQTAVKFQAGKADFSQGGFAPEQVFDGDTRNQGGWAVNGSNAHAHWLVLQTAEPLVIAPTQRMVVRIHQYHNAEQHRLGRFRVSFTNSQSETLPLGMAEPYRAVSSVAVEQRSEDDRRLLLDYLTSFDAGIQAAQNAIAAASAAVPEAAAVTAAKRDLERANQAVPLDATLQSLRTDFQFSSDQVAKLRQTAAEDLMWALINSPAFLFNR